MNYRRPACRARACGPPISARCASSSSSRCAHRRSRCRRCSSRSCSTCCSASSSAACAATAPMSQYIFATYGVFGAMGPGLFGFGVSLAIEREQGLLTLKQALPQPPGAYLLARAVMAMLFVAHHLADAHADGRAGRRRAADLLAGLRSCSSIDVLGALPFCAIGMCVGALVSGAGIAGHREPDLPAHGVPVGAVAAAAVHAASSSVDIAPIWPAYHLAQMALDTVGAPSVGHLSRVTSRCSPRPRWDSSCSRCAACMAADFGC